MKINSAKYVISGTRMEHFPPEGKPEFLLSGRSNVGKSSFINCVLNNQNLARTSSKPGKTQTLNYFLINDAFYFVDVPGYGYASVSASKRKEFGEMIERYFMERMSLKMVFLLVDFRHAPSEDDCIMYKFIKHFNLRMAIIATKKDKVNRSSWVKNEKLIRNTLMMDSNDIFIPCSVVTKEGIDEVHRVMEEVLKETL